MNPGHVIEFAEYRAGPAAAANSSETGGRMGGGRENKGTNVAGSVGDKNAIGNREKWKSSRTRDLSWRNRLIVSLPTLSPSPPPSHDNVAASESIQVPKDAKPKIKRKKNKKKISKICTLEIFFYQIIHRFYFYVRSKFHSGPTD